MEIIYIFCESERIRIPLIGYDKNLYRFFITRGGRWDKIHNEFILDGKINIEQLCVDSWDESLRVPLVLIKAQSPIPVKV